MEPDIAERLIDETMAEGKFPSSLRPRFIYAEPVETPKNPQPMLPDDILEQIWHNMVGGVIRDKNGQIVGEYGQ